MFELASPEALAGMSFALGGFSLKKAFRNVMKPIKKPLFKVAREAGRAVEDVGKFTEHVLGEVYDGIGDIFAPDVNIDAPSAPASPDAPPPPTAPVARQMPRSANEAIVFGNRRRRGGAGSSGRGRQAINLRG